MKLGAFSCPPNLAALVHLYPYGVYTFFATLGLFVTYDASKPVSEFLTHARHNCKWQTLNLEEEFCPKPRRSHMQFVRHRELYVYGGADQKQYHFNDMWKFSLDSLTWKQVDFARNKSPLGRRRGSAIWNARQDRVFVLCGTRPAHTETERKFLLENNSKDTER